MTKNERTELARVQAKAIVKQLQAGNERAARTGAPIVNEAQYEGLELTLVKKLLRAA